MTDEIAIRVEVLGKRYRLAAPASSGASNYTTLREELITWPRRLFGRRLLQEEFWALREVSFEVKRGEVLGIIGRNGAGKSTLLKILGRIVAPTTGSADLFGRVGSLLEVGTGFHPELTGRENIFLSGAILGLRRADVRRRFDEIVAFAGVEKFVDTPCKRYSSGMFMRLGFAVAAHLDAEILLIDEVLAVGDAEFQRRCLDRMRAVAREGRTVLFVSHNMSAVRQFCTKAILIEGGRAQWWDNRVDEAVHNYLATGTSAASEWRGRNHRATAGRWFRLETLRILDAEGCVLTGPVRGSEDVVIEIAGELSESHAALCVGFALYAEDDTAILWSYQTDPDAERRPQLEEGRNVLRARLPGGWLNEGRYRVDFLCGLHALEWIVSPRSSGPSVQFEVQGVGGTSNFRLLRRPVLLAPVLDWDRISAKENAS